MSNNKIGKSFKATIDGVEKDFKVYKPNIAEQREAQKVRNVAFNDAIKSKAILRSQLNGILRERGLWDDDKEAKFEGLRKSVLDNELKLETGGIKLSEGRAIALEMKKARLEMRDMLMERSTLDNETAEGQADNQMFNYLVSACTYLVYNDTGKEEKFFKSLDDYLGYEAGDAAINAASALSGLLYSNLGDDVQKKLPENKFLLDYKFVNDKLQLVNKKGHLIDENGRLINDQNQYVNENGELVDFYGRVVTSEGHYKVDKKPFLDDDSGQPVEIKTQIDDIKVESGVEDSAVKLS